MAQSGKPWNEMTPDEKADLVHRENRQLYDLLNQQAREIQILNNDVAKIKKALAERQILLG